MGVLNVTPDSFSDGGLFLAKDKAIERALQLEKEGASIIDIGGESTRPGAQPVPQEEELRRIIPVIEALRDKVNIPISIDTNKPGVAKEALDVFGVHVFENRLLECHECLFVELDRALR